MKNASFPSINLLIRNRDVNSLEKVINNLSPFEIANVIANKNKEEKIFVFSVLYPELAAATFEYLSLPTQKKILRSLKLTQVASMLTAMRPDDRTAILEELPRSTIDEYVKLLPPEEKSVTLTLLNYPEGSVGRLMTTDYIAVKTNWTIETVLDHIREYGHDSDTIDVIYVVDDNHVLLDDFRIKELFFFQKDYKVARITNNKFIALSVYEKVEQAIILFKQHNRVAFPVINETGVLLGVVTIDDILRLSSEKTTENMQNIGGMEALEGSYMETPFIELIKKRSRWLVILFLGEMLTATAMGFFEAEIAQAVVLALFLPLIISSGGNAGSQSTTLIIRAMALGEIKLKDWYRVMKREIFAGILLGILLGILGFARISLWSSIAGVYGEHWLLLAFTLCFSLIGVVLWGSLTGSMLPFLLKHLDIDPAVASAPLVATLVDVTGIIIYFGIAAVILKGTLL